MTNSQWDKILAGLEDDWQRKCPEGCPAQDREA
jgi:hypothetical protein